MLAVGLVISLLPSLVAVWEFNTMQNVSSHDQALPVSTARLSKVKGMEH